MTHGFYMPYWPLATLTLLGIAVIECVIILWAVKRDGPVKFGDWIIAFMFVMIFNFLAFCSLQELIAIAK